MNVQNESILKPKWINGDPMSQRENGSQRENQPFRFDNVQQRSLTQFGQHFNIKREVPNWGEKGIWIQVSWEAAVQRMRANQPKKPTKDLIHPGKKQGSKLRDKSHGDQHRLSQISFKKPLLVPS